MKSQQPASSDAGGENHQVEPWIPSAELPCSGRTLLPELSSLSIGKTTRLCHSMDRMEGWSRLMDLLWFKMRTLGADRLALHLQLFSAQKHNIGGYVTRYRFQIFAVCETLVIKGSSAVFHGHSNKCQFENWAKVPTILCHNLMGGLRLSGP